ncbi:MAG: hypothetical protein RJB13_1429 [Pseudomonadota bacterium]|jgi:hypothetical protein
MLNKIILAIIFGISMLTPKEGVASGFFSGKYKINCANSPAGCDCVTEPNVTQVKSKFFHAEPVLGALPSDQTQSGSTWTELKTNTGSCFYPTTQLRPIFWESDLCPQIENEEKVPLRSLDEMLAQGSVQSDRKPLGNLFPTFYNIADESFHPGPKTSPLYETRTGQLIAKVSESFHDDLDMEGTGVLNDGRVLNVGTRKNGAWDYVVLPNGAFGIGILNHNLHPYRSVAVDFKYLCQQAKLDFCQQSDLEVRRRLIGALIYIPRLKGISLPNGQQHDGYVCAQDIGGAIKGDRIDLFVGPLGGGNPYLKECRFYNPYNRAGVYGLVPYDWRTYVQNGTNADGSQKFRRVNEFEYRTFAINKALDSYLVQGAFCKP